MLHKAKLMRVYCIQKSIWKINQRKTIRYAKCDEFIKQRNKLKEKKELLFYFVKKVKQTYNEQQFQYGQNVSVSAVASM